MKTVTSPIQRDHLDLGRHSKMFRPSYRSSNLFSLTSDIDMWETKAHFTAQTSAWGGMATVSGTGYLNKVDISTPGSTSDFRQNDPRLKKWQSLSHLATEDVARPFPPSPGAELRAARGEGSLRQTGGLQWLQNAHEHFDAQLDRLRIRNSQLSNNITSAQLLDMKYKLSGTMGSPEQSKEEAGSSQSEKSRQHGEILQLEKDLLRMRSTLNKGSNDQPTETLREEQKLDTELCQLRAALREAEVRAKSREEERNHALQKLQASEETKKTLLNQIEELTQRRQNLSEVQEQLIEANKKISQACLEKAILSTQVLKQEDDIKELKAKLTGALADKDKLIQERADLELQLQTAQQRSEENEKLTRELEGIKQNLKTSQFQLQEEITDRVTKSKLISDLEAERSQLIREKEELLSKHNEDGHEDLTNIKKKCCQLSESVAVLESEKQKLLDLCLCLEARVLEKEENLHLQEEKHQRQDVGRVQSIEKLKAVASHWAEKWQKVALTLQSTQKELEELKKNSRHEKESDSLPRVELHAYKQELERGRSQAVSHRWKDEGPEDAVQSEDTETALSQSSLLWEPPSDSHSSQNKAPQASEADQGVSTTDSLKAHVEVSSRRSSQLPQEETPEVQKLQTLREFQIPNQQVKDEKPFVEVREDKTVSPVHLEGDQQRRIVTEQLKSLFKEREEKEERKVDKPSVAGQTGASLLQDWSQTPRVLKNTMERRSWHQGSGLTPVFEEDEEGGEGKPAEERCHNQSQQLSAITAEICNLKAKNDNLLQDDLQQKRNPMLYQDGIFLAEPVDICSPDEDEEERADK